MSSQQAALRTAFSAGSTHELQPFVKNTFIDIQQPVQHKEGSQHRSKSAEPALTPKAALGLTVAGSQKTVGFPTQDTAQFEAPKKVPASPEKFKSCPGRALPDQDTSVPGSSTDGAGPPPPQPAALPMPPAMSAPPPGPVSAPPPGGFGRSIVGAPTATPSGGILNGAFTGFGISSAPKKAQKDSDSVMKMLQRVQGNALQAKIEKMETNIPNQAPTALATVPGLGQEVTQLKELLPRSAPEPQWDTIMQRFQAGVPVTDDVASMLMALSPEQIIDLLFKVEGQPGFQHIELLSMLCRFLAPRLREFTGTQFTSLMSCMLAWEPRKLGEMPDTWKSFFNAASAEMSTRLMEFAPHEINCCLAAFMSVGFAELRFFSQVGRAAMARHASFGPVQLIALLTLLSEVRLTHLDLFNAAAHFLAARTKELRKTDLMRLLRAVGKCNIKCEQLCSAAGIEVVSRLKKGDKVPDGSIFKCEELCEIAWIFCVLQAYHEEFFKAMFKQLEQEPKVATDALCQLYECHLVLDSEHKEAYGKYRMEAEVVDALRELYKENRRDVRRCSERNRQDVSSVLKSLVEGSVAVNHRTSTGLLVDVAALRKRTSVDGFIHVEIDSSMSVIRALDQEETSPASLVLEGPVALRRRILEKHGLILVTVREADWTGLQDSREKRRHLRSLLSSLSDVLE